MTIQIDRGLSAGCFPTSQTSPNSAQKLKTSRYKSTTEAPSYRHLIPEVSVPLSTTIPFLVTQLPSPLFQGSDFQKTSTSNLSLCDSLSEKIHFSQDADDILLKNPPSDLVLNHPMTPPLLPQNFEITTNPIPLMDEITSPKTQDFCQASYTAPPKHFAPLPLETLNPALQGEKFWTKNSLTILLRYVLKHLIYGSETNMTQVARMFAAEHSIPDSGKDIAAKLKRMRDNLRRRSKNPQQSLEEKTFLNRSEIDDVIAWSISRKKREWSKEEMALLIALLAFQQYRSDSSIADLAKIYSQIINRSEKSIFEKLYKLRSQIKQDPNSLDQYFSGDGSTSDKEAVINFLTKKRKTASTKPK